MTSKRKSLSKNIQFDEDLESLIKLPDQPEDQEAIDRSAICRQEAIRVLQEDKEKLRVTLEDEFGVPSKSASDLVTSMAVICTEFNQYLAGASDHEPGSGSGLVLSELFHNFFNYRDWGLSSDCMIPSYVPEPWGVSFLNEFLLNTISWEIPFVYLSGNGVEVLTIPDFDFWMDFKASLQGTGDWDCLQSRSDDNLGAQSMISHGAMSALGCLLERLNVQYSPNDLKTLFKYIDTPRLICIFLQVIRGIEGDEFPLFRIDTNVDYEWRDFLETLGAFAGPRSVNLHSKYQVDEFMGIYKGFKGSFIGYVIDQHGILRFRKFEGWSRYIQFRDQYCHLASNEDYLIH